MQLKNDITVIRVLITLLSMYLSVKPLNGKKVTYYVKLT